MQLHGWYSDKEIRVIFNVVDRMLIRIYIGVFTCLFIFFGFVVFRMWLMSWWW